MNKKVVIILLLLGIIAAGAAFYGYNTLLVPNTAFEGDKSEIRIKSGSSYDDVFQQFKDQGVLANPTNFDLVAALMKYKKDKVPAGRYIIKQGMSSRAIITKLRSGDQDPMKVTINNVRILPELAGLLSSYFETDSLTMLSYLSDTTVIAQYGKTPQTMMTAFLPDTYEMFYTDKPEKIVKRLANHTKEYFEKNADKLAAVQLTANEAYTLASIVDKESNLVPEKPTIAGVYLNRLRIGERLAADPTVVFALQDFTLRRVLNYHLAYDSPYNTYKYAGLPPGPICMPEMSSINAVLNPEKHDYLFFCAKVGYNAGHSFAVTYSDHLRNADTYQKWLSSEGIK